MANLPAFVYESDISNVESAMITYSAKSKVANNSGVSSQVVAAFIA